MGAETLEFPDRLGNSGAGQVGLGALRYDILTSHRPGRTGGITHVNDPAVDARALAYFLDHDEALGGKLVGKSHQMETTDEIRLLHVLGLDTNTHTKELRVSLALYRTLRETGETIRREVQRVFTVGDLKEPEKVQWGEHYRVRTVIESSGAFNSVEGASRHLQDGGASNVLVTAPIDDPRLVDAGLLFGINHRRFDPDKHRIVKSGSCTWKALAATLKVLERCGLESGMALTVHALTQGDQVSLTRPRRDKMERGRSGAFSIVPTTTGSAGDVAHEFPSLAGKFDIQATRVPVPEGAFIRTIGNFRTPQTVEGLNDAFRRAAMGELGGIDRGIIDVDYEPMTSADTEGVPYRAILQSNLTSVLPGDPRVAGTTTWYANRYEAAAEAVDLAEYMARGTRESREAQVDPMGR